MAQDGMKWRISVFTYRLPLWYCTISEIIDNCYFKQKIEILFKRKGLMLEWKSNTEALLFNFKLTQKYEKFISFCKCIACKQYGYGVLF